MWESYSLIAEVMPEVVTKGFGLFVSQDFVTVGFTSRKVVTQLCRSLCVQQKDTSVTGSIAQAKHSRHGAAGGPRQFSGNPSTIVDPAEALEARVSLSKYDHLCLQVHPFSIRSVY